MIKIDAQTFEMGCDLGGEIECSTDEGPSHPVTISRDFYMGETEVTQDEYAAMMGASPAWCDWLANGPVELVSWHEAAAFANEMSAVEGYESCYSCSGLDVFTACVSVVSPVDCSGYRLPTEAEWEAAASCGMSFIYSGSDSVDMVAVYGLLTGTRDVASKAPNMCGLYDMSGNVMEWVQDWYGFSHYGTSIEIDPIGPPSGEGRSARGGDWYSNAEFTRVRARGVAPPLSRTVGLGFRVARTSP
jgi:formylglycine-generating enzyme required for sulfatase activity